MKKLSILALALSVLAVSCNKEAGKGDPGGAAGEIRVSATVNGITKAITDGAVTTFVNGDKLSLYVWTGDNTAVPADPWINGEVNTYNSETKLWEPKDLMKWKNLTDAHYFLGVYPARAITNFTADSYQQTGSYEKDDLLVATILGEGVKASVAPVPLNMDHLMAKLKVALTLRNQWSGNPEVHVYVKAAATGTVDYLSKTITPGNEIVDLSFINGAGEDHSTLIIPQEGVKEITILVNGSKYVYTHPTSIPLTKGHVTTLPLVVGKDVIALDGNVTVEGWTAGELPEGLGGDAVVAPKVTDLGTIKADYVASDKETLYGTLDANVKISIADGATVTFDGLTINGVNDANYKWAGITCLGDATIILKEGSVNSVMGFYQTAPGIFIPEGKTLIIKGDGNLTASPVYYYDVIDYDYGVASAIGGGNNIPCGNIEIQGGNIRAIGGNRCPGIGSGRGESNCGTITISGGTVVAIGGYLAPGIGCGDKAGCGNINISGGTVEATGGDYCPAIGSANGDSSVCGDITITDGVTKVTATKGKESPNSIGAGNKGATCGTVTIGGVVGAITESPYVYPLPYPIDLSEVTSAYVGSVISAQSAKVYKTVADAIADGEEPVAIIAYVGAPGSVEEFDPNFKGLAIALSDAYNEACIWADPDDGIDDCLPLSQTEDIQTALSFKNGETCTNALEAHGEHSHMAAVYAKNNKSVAHPEDATTWFLPSIGQWNLILQGLAKKADNITDSADNNYYKAGNLNSVITAAGGEGFRADDYWTSSENFMTLAWIIDLSAGRASYTNKGNGDCYVRSAFAF